MLAGLQVIEYLLKQPGKPAHVLAINRAVCDGEPRVAAIEEAFSRSEEQQGLDGFTADAWQSPDPYSEKDLEAAKEALKSLEERAVRAWESGEYDKAEELERSADGARWLIQEEQNLVARKRRGQPDVDAEVERVRVKLTNNFKNACKALRKKYDLPELADHLEAQISRGAEWKYNTVAGVEWAFDPERC
jgi:hypothetical protein